LTLNRRNETETEGTESDRKANDGMPRVNLA